MLNTLLIGTLVVLFAGAAPVPELAADVGVKVPNVPCPPDHPILRQRVVKMLSNPAVQGVRQQNGWDVSPSQLRVLTDTTDAAVCQVLRDNIQFQDPSRIISYYTAGGLYFVATERVTAMPPGHMIVSRWEPLMVFRSDLSLVGSYAN